MPNPFKNLETERIANESAAELLAAQQRRLREDSMRAVDRQAVSKVLETHAKVTSIISSLIIDADVFKLLDHYSKAFNRGISISVTTSTIDSKKSRVLSGPTEIREMIKAVDLIRGFGYQNEHRVSSELLRLFIKRKDQGVTTGEMEKDYRHYFDFKDDDLKGLLADCEFSLEFIFIFVLAVVCKIMRIDLDMVGDASRYKNPELNFIHKIEIVCGDKKILIDENGIQINDKSMPQPLNRQSLIRELVGS